MSRRRLVVEEQWHLDKKIPIAIIVAIFIQTGAWIWWASALNERVNVLEKIAAGSPAQDSRLTRVEVRVESMQNDVSEIKADVKGLVRKGRTE